MKSRRVPVGIMEPGSIDRFATAFFKEENDKISEAEKPGGTYDTFELTMNNGYGEAEFLSLTAAGQGGMVFRRERRQGPAPGSRKSIKNKLVKGAINGFQR